MHMEIVYVKYLLYNLLIFKMYFCQTDCAAVHDGPEDTDEECTGGQPIGQPAEGGRSHLGEAEEGE